MSDRLAPPVLVPDSAHSAEQARRLLTLGEQIVPGHQVLAGRFVALMCSVPADPAAQRLARAAADLGMQVTQVAPPFEGQRIDALARILDQLYDAVDCVGMVRAEVQQLARACRVPVFDSLAGSDRPLAALATDLRDPALDGAPDAHELRHRRLVQAVLVECISGAETLV
ncbi:MAG: hypothetical protein JO369_02860 [Paucibacter sp.]|nr:hypothetical protein [Roseateles sp.]